MTEETAERLYKVAIGAQVVVGAALLIAVAYYHPDWFWLVLQVLTVLLEHAGEVE